MRDVVGSTKEEIRLIKSIQRKVGALDNGYIGCQTLSDIAIDLGVNCFPLNVTLYGQPTIISKEIDPISPVDSLPKNSISGSFNGGTYPCSILVSRTQGIKRWCSCHFESKHPETVLYKLKDGTVGVKKVVCISDEFNINELEIAVGGFGLLDMWDPKGEGFTGKYSDVLRKTNHTVLGFRNGMFYGVYFKNMTAQQINTACKNKFKFDFAIMLDGGHVAAINAECNKINTKLIQYYAIKFE